MVSDLLKDSFDYLRIPHRKAIAAKKIKTRFITEILTKIYMNTIRISKEFTFEMAHALPSKLIKTNYQPTCENLLTDIAGRIQSAILPPVKLCSL